MDLNWNQLFPLTNTKHNIFNICSPLDLLLFCFAVWKNYWLIDKRNNKALGVIPGNYQVPVSPAQREIHHVIVVFYIMQHFQGGTLSAYMLTNKLFWLKPDYFPFKKYKYRYFEKTNQEENFYFAQICIECRIKSILIIKPLKPHLSYSLSQITVSPTF